MLVLNNEMQVQFFLVIKLGRKLSFYHTSNSRECMGVNGEVLRLYVVYKKPYFFTASHTRIRISTTRHARICISSTSHVRFRIRYCKPCMLCLIVQWNQATPEKISLVCCRWHCYSCCTLITIQTATNLWYSFVLWWYNIRTPKVQHTIFNSALHSFL